MQWSYLKITRLFAYYLLSPHKSPNSPSLFQHYIQKWFVNYRVSQEGDSAVL